MEIKIRAHHGMCLAFFQGKGYSSEFAEHMGRVKLALEKNPQVRVLNETDDICAHCPKNFSGRCENPAKTAGYDHAVLKLCRIDAGAEMSWHDFEMLVKNRILDAGKRKAVCGDCQWNALCNE